MSRNILQDVLPPEKKSIRDIPIPIERRRRAMQETVTSSSPSSRIMREVRKKIFDQNYVTLLQ